MDGRRGSLDDDEPMNMVMRIRFYQGRMNWWSLTIVYRIEKSRSHKAAKNVLGGFEGVVMTDVPGVNYLCAMHTSNCR